MPARNQLEAENVDRDQKENSQLFMIISWA
jgi:hypothetical protein